MGHRVVRIGLLAFTTALLICYRSSILSWSTRGWRPDEATLRAIESPIPGASTANTEWPVSPADATYPDPEDGSSHVVPPGDGTPPHESGSEAATPPSTGFNEAKYEFQQDLLLYTQPAFDVAKLRQYRPHNDRGPGQSAFATYLSTRDNSVHDPYFLSAMQLVYRILWDPKSRSQSHPIVVFVAPFIPQEQRDLLQASGAIVRELELVPWDPPRSGSGAAGGDDMFPFARWRDLFSKLNIWGQLDLSRVAFLDLDAFPVRCLDDLLGGTVAPRQRCRAELLGPEDGGHEPGGICDYVFAGHSYGGGVNVGVMVLEPNRHMHARLLRECRDTGKFDSRMAEQAFLNYAFGQDGPFPAHLIGREWNGFYPQADEEGLLRVVHEKLWVPGDFADWTRDIFRTGWFELLTLYQSDQFEALRAEDGLLQ